jgi:hypothetical protein
MAPGGSFLGTAAAAATGMIGGSLLLDGIRSMMGHGQGAFGMTDPAFGASHDSGSPWNDGTGGDLARQAGMGDIGHDQHPGGGGDSGSGLLDNTGGADAADAQADQDVGDYDDNGSDFAGGDFGGGGDFGSSDV